MQVSDREVDLAFPLFDADGSGDIDVDELLSFCTRNLCKGKGTGDVRRALRQMEHHSSHFQRQERIDRKTRFRQAIDTLRTNLREAIKRSNSPSTTAEQLFDNLNFLC